MANESVEDHSTSSRTVSTDVDEKSITIEDRVETLLLEGDEDNHFEVEENKVTDEVRAVIRDKSNKELNIITQTLQRKVSKSPLDDEEEIILQVAREELKNRDIRISTGETLVMSVLYVLGIIISVKIFTETIN